MLPTADISHHVGQERLIEDPLDICFHNIGKHAWAGITTMLAALGGADIKERGGIKTLGYGTTRIDHARATLIAQHPLVRRVDVVPRIALR